MASFFLFSFLSCRRNTSVIYLTVCNRKFHGRFPSRRFHGKGHENRPHFVLFAKIAEELAGPPLKPSMERLPNTIERLGLRAGEGGVLQRSVFCLFGPLLEYPSSPKHKDRRRADAGRGSRSLVGQPCPWSQPSLLYIRYMFSEIS